MVLSLFWLLWPLYGFVSNQFAIARSPFGWTELPVSVPHTQVLKHEPYLHAGNAAMEILSLRQRKINAPSISAAVNIDGKLVWAGSVGWADIKTNTPATPETAYRIGSTSKAVGATVVARLVDAGEININTPISKYMQNIPNDKWKDLTLRQLLSHTAGLPAYEENTDWIGFYHSLALRKHFDTATAGLGVFDGSKMLYEAEQAFHYSAFDNILASAVMESIKGISFEQLTRKTVSIPLNLSSLRLDSSNNRDLRVATSYQERNAKFKPWRTVDLSHKLAAGGFMARPSDLAVLGSAWLDENFVSKDTRNLFWTPVKVQGRINEHDYALGFRKKSLDVPGAGKITHLNHGGISKGAQCWLMIAPDHQISIAISTNRRTENFFDFADIYADLLAVFLEARKNRN